MKTSSSSCSTNPFCNLQRAKATNGNKDQEVVVTEPVFLKVYDDYIKCFDEDQKRNFPRIWHSFRSKSCPEKSLNKTIGQNPFSNCLRNFARWHNERCDGYDLNKEETLYKKFSIEDIKRVTWHGLRRLGATLLANSGLSLELLMIAGNWTSPGVARTYINESLFVKRTIADKMSTEIQKLTSNADLIFRGEEKGVTQTTEVSEDESECSAGHKRRLPVASSDNVFNIAAGAVVNFNGVSFGNFCAPPQRCAQSTFNDDEGWTSFTQDHPEL